MFLRISDVAFRAIAISTLLISALPSQAAERSRVRWHVVGVVSGLAQPATTEAYFPRPLAPGEVIDMTFTIDSSVPGEAANAYARYAKAILSGELSGSDWSIPMRSPLNDGEITVTDDHVDYGDMLDLRATTSSRPGRTWYSIEINMRNPGTPPPLVGPFQPFTSLALPKKPPALGFFPAAYFYITARRELPGQPPDGASYFGYITSIQQVRCND